MATFTELRVKCCNSHLVSAGGLKRQVQSRRRQSLTRHHVGHNMIVRTVVLLACNALVTSAVLARNGVIKTSLGLASSGSARVRNDIVMYRPSEEDALDGEYDLLAHKHEMTCAKPGLQCTRDGTTLVECSGSLDAISAWDCHRIFPKQLFLEANTMEVLCDPFRGSCAALVQVMEPENDHKHLEPAVDVMAAKKWGPIKQTGVPFETFQSTNEVGDSASQHNHSITKDVSEMAANNNTDENKNDKTDKIAAVDSPPGASNHVPVESNVSSTLTNSSSADENSGSAEPVASLPYVRCEKQGLHCANTATIVDCDNQSSEPLFEMSCSSMLQSSDMESDSGMCDDATTSCLLMLGGFPLRMRIFQSNKKMEGVCQDGTLTCADNSTLVACSGDSNIPSYAINCAGDERNDIFTSYCDTEQKGCVIKRKEPTPIPEVTSNATISQGPIATTTAETTLTKKPSSIVAIPSMFLIPPLIPLSENVGTTTEAGATTGEVVVCQDAGWKCNNASTLILCSSSQAQPLAWLDCSSTDHAYCDVMNGRCTLGDSTVPQSPCTHPGLQCLTTLVLGWCSTDLQVRHASLCDSACDAVTHDCKQPSTTTTSQNSSTTLIQKPSSTTITTEHSSSTVPSVAPLQQAPGVQPPPVAPGNQPPIGPCSRAGMQCISTDMLGSCNADLTLSYVVPCAKLLPYADANSVQVFCDREIDACAISQVLDTYTE